MDLITTEGGTVVFRERNSALNFGGLHLNNPLIHTKSHKNTNKLMNQGRGKSATKILFVWLL